MSLDIGIGDGISVCPDPNEPSLSLEDDGYYWFLHPLFKDLQAATGQYIDLAGDASFAGSSLKSSEDALARARDLVEREADGWSVCVGHELVPWAKGKVKQLKPLFSIVSKDRFRSLLSRWQSVIVRARDLQRPVVCFGD